MCGYNPAPGAPEQATWERLHVSELATGSPGEVWSRGLDLLKAQIERATFDAWLSRTWVIEREGSEWVIGVPNARALDWLSRRLAPLIARTLSWTAGEPASVRFVVGTEDLRPAASHEASSIDQGSPVLEAVREERVPVGAGAALVWTDFYIKLKVAFRKRALKKLKGARLSVFLCLSLHVDRDRIARPGGIETIMHETGYSRSAVCSALEYLESAGLIRKLRQHQVADRYRVLGYAWFGDQPAEALWESKSKK